jgi:NAD-dependent DNA ligase
MKLSELTRKIESTSEAYYHGEPLISDDEFDALILELHETCPGHELLHKISTGYDPQKDQSGEKAQHKYRTVGSLSNINK